MNRNRRRRRIYMASAHMVTLAATIVMSLLIGTARADEITPKDIQVIGRTLGFMEDAESGSLELGIVYAPDEPDTLRQAKAIQALIGSGVLAGKLTLHPKLLAADELVKLEHIGALFIVPGVPSIVPAVAAAAQRLHVPTVSTDMSYAQAGKCMIGIHSAPIVEILFSHDAAADAGVRFTPAFRMLVKQN